MTDEPVNGHEPMIEDQMELQLRHRITALEEWRPAVQEAVGLLAIGLIALVLAAATTLVIVRKRLP